MSATLMAPARQGAAVPLDAADAASATQFIAHTARLLDEESLEAWLDLFATGSHYEITAFSTELRRWTPWWTQELEALRKTVKEVPRHVRDPAQRLHILSTPRLTALEEGRLEADTPFAIYRSLPTGETSLYAVGTYLDRLVREGGQWRYAAHVARMQTRMLDAFTHLPL